MELIEPPLPELIGGLGGLMSIFLLASAIALLLLPFDTNASSSCDSQSQNLNEIAKLGKFRIFWRRELILIFN